MGDSLGIAVVGYGMTATSHTRTLAADGHRLAWLIGRLPDKSEAFAREHGYARHGVELAQALDDPSVDAVFLGTPSNQHEEQAIACLDAGKHVMVEIPVAMSGAGAERVATRAAQSGKVVMVAHTHRFYAGVRRAHAEIAAGTLDPHAVIARYLFLRRENIGASGYRRSWTDNLLWHHGCHAVDTSLYLLGVRAVDQVEVVSIVATPDSVVGAPLDLSIVIRTADNRLATVAMSYNSHLSRYDYLITGAQDTLEIRQGQIRVRGSVGEIEPEELGPTPVVLQNRNFVAAIQSGTTCAITPADVLPAMQVLQVVQDAADALAPRG